MFFLPEILVFCLFLFLYVVFVLAKDDFTLLRKNVTLEQLFSISIIGFLLSLVSARLLYVLEHVSAKYINPLVFLLFPYFPGLSLIGGVGGAILFCWYQATKRKFPFGRMFDVFTVSFFLSYAIGMILVTIADGILLKRIDFVALGASVVFFLFFLVIIRAFMKSIFTDASLGYAGFSVFFLLQLTVSLVSRWKNFLHFIPEDIFYIIAVLLFAAIFINREKLSFLTKSVRRK